MSACRSGWKACHLHHAARSPVHACPCACVCCRQCCCGAAWGCHRGTMCRAGGQAPPRSSPVTHQRAACTTCGCLVGGVEGVEIHGGRYARSEGSGDVFNDATKLVTLRQVQLGVCCLVGVGDVAFSVQHLHKDVCVMQGAVLPSTPIKHAAHPAMHVLHALPSEQHSRLCLHPFTPPPHTQTHALTMQWLLYAAGHSTGPQLAVACGIQQQHRHIQGPTHAGVPAAHMGVPITQVARLLPAHTPHTSAQAHVSGGCNRMFDSHKGWEGGSGKAKDQHTPQCQTEL